MNREEFKLKYFTNNFYWVNNKNYKQLQEIGLDFGCFSPIGDVSIIEWHDGFNNLGFRTYGSSPTRFQKECFLVDGDTATSFEDMIKDYKSLK